MNIINYAISILLMLGVIWEVYMVLKRNKTIRIKGKDDILSFSLAVIFILVIFPISDAADLVESIRNILFLVFLFGTTGIKRGFSEQGMEKVCYTLNWEDIKKVYVSEYQGGKIQVICEGRSRKHKLLFAKAQLKAVLGCLQTKVPEIYIQGNLQKCMKEN